MNTPQPLASSVLRDLRSNNGLAVILGYSSNTKEEENTTQAANASIAGFQYATKINPSDIQLTTNVAQKLKINNSVVGRYRQNSADLSGTNSSLWVYDNAMFIILGQDGWRSDNFDGNVKPIAAFSDITGKVARTTEGIYYQCVNVLPTLFGVNSGSRYALTTRQDFIDKYDKNSTSTSKSVTATNICGPGSETRIGNCCLYYPNATKDTVSGATYASGDFYDCICTQCHKCVEMARKLDMRYVFNAHTATTGSLTGGTGPSCQCMADFPNDCGPCACRIETPDVVDKVLNDRNISTENSDRRNAQIAKNNKLYAGFMGIWMNLTNIDEESRVLHDDYQVNGTKFGEVPQLPLISSLAAGKEAKYKISTYRASNGKLYCKGLTLVQEGYGYVDGEVDSAKLKSILPRIPVSVFTIHVTPFIGFFASIPESPLFKPQVKISKQITGPELQNAGVQLDKLKLNRATFGTFETVEGTKVFDDLESGESQNLNLQTLVEVQRTDGSDFAADFLDDTVGVVEELGGGGFFVGDGSFPGAGDASNTGTSSEPVSLKSSSQDVISSAKFKTGGDLGTIKLSIDTVLPDDYESKNFTMNGVDITASAVTRPSYNGENIATRGNRVESILTSQLPNEIDFSSMTNNFLKTFTFTIDSIIG